MQEQRKQRTHSRRGGAKGFRTYQGGLLRIHHFDSELRGLPLQLICSSLNCTGKVQIAFADLTKDEIIEAMDNLVRLTGYEHTDVVVFVLEELDWAIEETEARRNG